jgi:choline dehydrogenase-like flavoprotein
VPVTDRYDVIIAGGGTLAHTLAPSGKRILILKRGVGEHLLDRMAG